MTNLVEWKAVYNNWKNADLPKDLRQELESLDETQLEEAFYQDLGFGTAGMRGLLGVGTNRMNIFTVRQITEALARYIESEGDDAKKRGVAISYDSRHYSKEFAENAAKVLSLHGINVYLFSSLRPTPELSFTVRQKKCFAGIMMTASHNPKEYNGYKLYGEDGGQMAPTPVKKVTKYLAQIDDIFSVKIDEEGKYVNIIDKEMDDLYLAELKQITINHDLIAKEGKDLKLVYTPLHGTGQYIGELALKQAGFTNYTIVKEQAVIDGDFPTVKKPNPEEKEALALAIEYAKKEDADVVIGTDPDSDRMGAAVRLPDGSYDVLTGNQIAAIMLNYLLLAKKKANTLPNNGAIVTSIVSSNFAAKVAKSYNVDTISVLTGFKYIAEQIEISEHTKAFEFLFGFEESFGYLIKPFSHDKDAIQALLMFAEVAAHYKHEKISFYDGIQNMFKEFGYFKEFTLSKEFKGISGKDDMDNVIAQFRNNPLTTITDLKVVQINDYLQSESHNLVTDEKTELTDDKSNVIKYFLEDGSWVAIRPSGTEPKLKLYIGVVGETDELSQAKLDNIKEYLHNKI